jgi:glucose/mannose-6-phosphate isomerase
VISGGIVRIDGEHPSMTSRLDDPALARTCDPSRMLETALGLPSQVREAWRIGGSAALPALPGSLEHVVVAGMGGSAIGGDLLAAVLRDRLGLPLIVIRDYSLPPFVGRRSLVIATSYSGETEETLAAAEDARRAGAVLLAITSGGRLAGIAERAGGGAVLVPGGLAPRAALGYLMVPVLAAFERWSICGPLAGEVDEAAAILDDLAAGLGPLVPASRNPAKRLAEQLLGRIPAVYAAAPDVEAAARRWKCQFNENSKTLATWNTFPELAHNETMGWGAPAHVAGLFAVIVLLAGHETARALLRVRTTCDLAFRHAAGVHEFGGRGTGRLARILSLVLLGDLASIYLAYLRGVDPTPIEAITAVKQRMREEA